MMRVFYKRFSSLQNLPPLTSKQTELLKQLTAHVAMLAGDIGARSLTHSPDNLVKAANYIEYILNKHGLSTTREEFTAEVFNQKNKTFTADSIKFESVQHLTWNVVAEIRGSVSPNEIVIVGAHYDSVYDCPAANDNASGVAALLEIAAALATKHLKKTLRLVAFTNEEPPFFRTDLMGSFLHAQKCKSKSEKITAMVCLETIGFYTDETNSQKYPHPLLNFVAPKSGNFLALVSNFKSQSLLQKCSRSFNRFANFPLITAVLPGFIKGVESSDHANFWKFEFQAVLVTDTANYRYPHCHEATDTPDKLNCDALTRVVDGLIGVVDDLCNL